MAITRKMLAAIGIDPEKIEEIVAAHIETVNALKDERDAYKAEAEKLEAVQKELDTLKAQGGDMQKKYDDEHAAFEKYKSEVEAAEMLRKKSDIFRTALRKAGIPEKMIEPLIKIANVGSVELDKDGAATNLADVEKSIKSDFADYIRTEKTELDRPDTPPTPATGKAAFDAMTLTEKMRYANEHPNEVKGYL